MQTFPQLWSIGSGEGKDDGRQQEVRNVPQRRPAVPVNQQAAVGRARRVNQEVVVSRITIGDEMQCRRIVRGRNCQTLQSKSNHCALLGAYLKVVWDDVGKSEPLWGVLH